MGADYKSEGSGAMQADQRILVERAVYETDDRARIAAIQAVTEQDALLALFENGAYREALGRSFTGGRIREYALDRLEQPALETLARNGAEERTRLLAVKRLHSRVLLGEIAGRDESYAVRQAATDRMAERVCSELWGREPASRV